MDGGMKLPLITIPEEYVAMFTAAGIIKPPKPAPSPKPTKHVSPAKPDNRTTVLRRHTGAIPLLPVSEIARRAVTKPRTLCGVYFLLLRDQVVYVGQSVDVMGRVTSHITADPRRLWDSFSVLECQADRLCVTERAYLDQLLPPYNKDWATRRLRLSLSSET